MAGNALPQLREDLTLAPGEPLKTGEKTWTVFDPVQHRYFRIGEDAFDILRAWKAEPIDRVLERANTNRETRLTVSDVEAAATFVAANGLTIEPPGGDPLALARKEAASKPTGWSQAMHKYIFVRIPLLRPDPFLKATYPLVTPFFTRAAWMLISLFALTGLYLVSQQWDAFLATFLHFLSPEGALFYGLSLIAIMSLHEFGHAYAAHRYGCRVSTIGVAIIVLMPIMYTDTTDAWRLTDRRKRLVIDTAGVAVELIIATAATLFWVFLPDGPARSVAFFAATTSWILSLAVNLNPFMRFDGYYVLSDLVGVSNLNQRSFAFGRWRLRELLFGLGHSQPEPAPRWMATAMTAFAWGAWVYRFFLFLGIALLVHAMFSKALGIILFLVEIGYFIGKPIWSEIKTWWSLRADIRARGGWRSTALVGACCFAVFFVPWRSEVRAPAIATPYEVASIHAPAAGQIRRVHVEEGETVKAGDLLFTLALPDIQNGLERANIRIELLQDQLDRAVDDVQDRSDSAVILRSLVSERERADGLKRLLADARIRAPHDGVVTDLDRTLARGQWINAQRRLVRIVDPTRFEIKAMAAETSIARIMDGAEVKFIPDDPAAPTLDATTHTIATAAVVAIDEPAFAQTSGGRLAVREDADGRLVPETAVFEVRSDVLAETGTVTRSLTGVAMIDARAESPAEAVWRRVAGVLLRETDF
ncbi:MAG: HlyD family efflux transporter periplasmic adaptor subunit [Pseudomonadota bacterium]